MLKQIIGKNKNKNKNKTEYIRRVRSALMSKLNAGNIFQAINISVVPTVRYGTAKIQWTKEELQRMERKSRKLITTYGKLHPRGCVDRL